MGTLSIERACTGRVPSTPTAYPWLPSLCLPATYRVEQWNRISQLGAPTLALCSGPNVRDCADCGAAVLLSSRDQERIGILLEGLGRLTIPNSWVEPTR